MSLFVCSINRKKFFCNNNSLLEILQQEDHLRGFLRLIKYKSYEKY